MEETGRSTGRPKVIRTKGQSTGEERLIEREKSASFQPIISTLVIRRNILFNHTVMVIVHVTPDRVENLIIHRTSNRVVRRNGLSSGAKFALGQMLL